MRPADKTKLFGVIKKRDEKLRHPVKQPARYEIKFNSTAA